jgi:NAD(P)-dependent dehydrogenase (short-subunit alcohol dehydrogenase family)
MKGKTVLFTGASRGMGRSAAIELARRGAEILVEETLGISAALRGKILENAGPSAGQANT